jgi:hypothetical protein
MSYARSAAAYRGSKILDADARSQSISARGFKASIDIFKRMVVSRRNSFGMHNGNFLRCGACAVFLPDSPDLLEREDGAIILLGPSVPRFVCMSFLAL